MNIFELLASPLAHGVDLGAIARSTLKSGQPTDIEWCLAGLPEFQEHLVRAKYQLDKQSKHAAWGIWFPRLMDLGWREGHPHVVENMATDTLDWWIDPQKCTWCRGVGEILADQKILTCEACSGTGRQDRKPYSIIRALGWEDRNLRPIWVERHRVAMAILDLQEAVAKVHMLRRWRPLALNYENG